MSGEGENICKICGAELIGIREKESQLCLYCIWGMKHRNIHYWLRYVKESGKEKVFYDQVMGFNKNEIYQELQRRGKSCNYQTAKPELASELMDMVNLSVEERTLRRLKGG